MSDLFRRAFQTTSRPSYCPWGQIDHAKEIAPGIWQVETPGHGGMLISAERRAAMPSYLRDIPTYAGGNAYEEDCDVALVIAAFPDAFNARAVEYAQKMIAAHDREADEWQRKSERALQSHKAWRAAAQRLKREPIAA